MPLCNEDTEGILDDLNPSGVTNGIPLDCLLLIVPLLPLEYKVNEVLDRSGYDLFLFYLHDLVCLTVRVLTV